MSQRGAAALGVVLLWLLWPGATVAAGDPRLESVKQHALALYTLSLAQRRQFNDHAMVLLEAPDRQRPLRSLRLSINGEPWAELRYGRLRAELLERGACQQLGILPLSRGRHRIRLEWEDGPEGADSQAGQHVLEQELDFAAWPLTLHIRLGAAGEARLQAQLPGEALLRAADFERALGHPGKAVSLLQNLAHVDPALAQGADYARRMGESLADWGLATAAESIFAALAQTAARPAERLEAGLRAAELALGRGEAAQAARHLQSSPTDASARRQELAARSLLGQGALDLARERMPARGSGLWRYNLALALFKAGDETAGEAILQSLAAESTAAGLADQARLQLGWRQLQRGETEAALENLAGVRGRGDTALRARLRRGWAQLQLAAPAVEVEADPLRPAFAARIDALFESDAVSRSRRIVALRAALGEWLPLLDEDPQHGAVQEALVAVPYALAALGLRARAVEHAELAIRRLEALRQGLRRDLGEARAGGWLDARQLAAEAWPPQAATWPFASPGSTWWAEPAGTMPADWLRPRLARQAETLRALQAMRTLQDVESLLRGAARVPDLQARSERQMESLAAERRRQQLELDRFVLRWLRAEFRQVTAYLVLARFTLARLLEQGGQDAP